MFPTAPRPDLQLDPLSQSEDDDLAIEVIMLRNGLQARPHSGRAGIAGGIEGTPGRGVAAPLPSFLAGP